MTEITIVSSPEEGGDVGARAVLDLVREKADAVLGLATGSSAGYVYRSLAATGKRLTGIRAFMLDEYVGIPRNHPQSYWSVIQRQVVIPLGLDSSSLFSPAMSEGSEETAAGRYEERIAAVGGIDLQLLGIGTTGHIGFNEPGSSLASRTRLTALTEQTRMDNARFFGSPEEVPRLCVTQGVGTILEARHLLLLAFGAEKSGVVAAAVEGPISSSCPASAIQLHPRVTLVVDEAAASGLNFAGYHRAFQAESQTG